MSTEHNPFAALLDGVPRYRLNGYDAGTEADKEGGIVFLSDILAALAAAYPADLAEAGKVLEGVTPGPWRTHAVDDTAIISSDGTDVGTTCDSAKAERDDAYNNNYEQMEADARFIAWCREGVPALLARIAAQEAQIKGLVAERDRFEAALGRACLVGGTTYLVERAEAAETALAAMTKERDGWKDAATRHHPNPVDHRYWEGRYRDEAAALAAMTKERDEALEASQSNWNAAKRYVDEIVKLNAALAAERAKAAKLVEKLTALEKVASEVARRGAETGPQWTKLTIALLAARAAITEAQQ